MKTLTLTLTTLLTLTLTAQDFDYLPSEVGDNRFLDNLKFTQN